MLTHHMSAVPVLLLLLLLLERIMLLSDLQPDTSRAPAHMSGAV